jgi:hypothetical protein
MSSIDRADGRICVGIGGQKRALGIGKNLPRSLQKTDAIHLGHALVGEKQGNSVIADFQFLKKIKRPARRIAAQHAIVSAVFGTEVPLNRPQYIRIVINRQKNGLCHDYS